MTLTERVFPGPASSKFVAIAIAIAVCLPLGAGCENKSQPSGSATTSPTATTAVAATTPAIAPAPGASGAPGTKGGIKWMQGPSGLMDVSDTVKAAYAKERAEGRTLLVYVGATWCEPCQRFHHAVERGELDAAFPRLSFLAFDTDHDGEALANGGYYSRLIPLMALPNPDGKASGKQIEGSVKGEAALGDLTPRLRELIAGGS